MISRTQPGEDVVRGHQAIMAFKPVRSGRLEWEDHEHDPPGEPADQKDNKNHCHHHGYPHYKMFIQILYKIDYYFFCFRFSSFMSANVSAAVDSLPFNCSEVI